MKHALMKSVSVVIPTLARPAKILTTVEHLLSLQAPGLIEVIVVDQSPEINTGLDSLSSLDARLHVLRDPVRNVSRARNLGARHTQGEIIVFLDDDLLPCRDYFYSLQQALATHCSEFLTGPVIDPGFRLRSRSEIDPPILARIESGHDVQRDVDFAYRPLWSGSGNFIGHKSAFLASGGFDENLYRFNEDAELCHRIGLKRFSLTYDPALAVDHVDEKVGGTWLKRSVAADMRSALDNQLYFYRKIGYSGTAMLGVLLREFKNQVWHGAKVRQGSVFSRLIAFIVALPSALAHMSKEPSWLDTALSNK
jgi:glycosyltransferase involved in cell wall biosynthesis